MKIVHLNINEQFGGAAQAVNRLHHGLLKLGVDSRLLVLNKESKDDTVTNIAELYTKRDKLRLFTRKAFRTIKTVFHLKRDERYNPPSLLLSVLDRIEYDFIHLHWVTGSFVNFNELAGIKKPIIWTMHDCAAFTGICNVIGSCTNFKNGCGKCPLINSTLKWDISSREFTRKKRIFKSLSLNMVSPSRWLAENASFSPLLSGKTISVIPHGLDTEEFSPLNKVVARKIFNVSPGAKIIVCGSVTFADSNKGIQFLLDAIKMMSTSNTGMIDTELFLFGENPDERLLSGIKSTSLGFIRDSRLLRIVYSMADVVVVPSKQEAFGQTALEALACGTPVAAFAATGLLDIVDHKKNGYLAIPYDSGDLASGILWCLKNNTENILSDNARRKVTECFDIKVVAQRYTELYNIINGYQ